MSTPNPHVVVYATFKEVEDIAKATMDQDKTWQNLPADKPEEGIVGQLLVRPVDGAALEKKSDEDAPVELKEEAVWFQWKPFGEVVPVLTVLPDAGEVLAILKDWEGKNVFRCDDPMKRQCGFVRYTPKRAQILRIGLTAMKSSPFFKDLMDVREKMPLLGSLRTP